MGDFNTPGFDWECGLPLPNCHYYSKFKGDTIYTSACRLALTQSIETNYNNLLDLGLFIYFFIFYFLVVLFYLLRLSRFSVEVCNSF
jgi:hypothetical protein